MGNVIYILISKYILDWIFSAKTRSYTA